MLCCALFSACSNDDIANAPEEDADTGVSTTVPTKYLDGINEEGTRASLSLVGNSMIYKWNEQEGQDKIGVFNVSYTSEQSQNIGFVYKLGTQLREGTTTLAKFKNDNYSFNQDNWWVAYAPHTCYNSNGVRSIVTKYDEIKLTYEGQQAKYNATPSGLAPKAAAENDASSYNADTEAKASQSLADYDYLISAPAHPDDEGYTTFHFSHVGSTVRFWVLFPEGAFGSSKKGYIKSMDLLCTSSKIVKDVTLAINKQEDASSATTPSYTEKSKVTTQKLTLNLPGTNGNGIELPDVTGGCNFITYMEFYPTKFLANECYLYMTVVVDGIEKHFKSNPLPAKNIVAGNLYQWYPDAYNPIELTATLKTWEEVIAEDINIGLEN